MMKCEVIRDLLPLYIDDACSKGSRELVEEHLKECADCRRELTQMQTCIVADKEEIDTYIDDERILKTGKKVIEKEIKKDFLEKAAWVDLPLNLIIALAGVCFCMTAKWTRDGIAYVLPTVLLASVAMPVTFAVWEMVFIIGSRKNKNVSTSQMIVMGSVLLKAIVLLMACIVELIIILG